MLDRNRTLDRIYRYETGCRYHSLTYLEVSLCQVSRLTIRTLPLRSPCSRTSSHLPLQPAPSCRNPENSSVKPVADTRHTQPRNESRPTHSIRLRSTAASDANQLESLRWTSFQDGSSSSTTRVQEESDRSCCAPTSSRRFLRRLDRLDLDRTVIPETKMGERTQSRVSGLQCKRRKTERTHEGRRA